MNATRLRQTIKSLGYSIHHDGTGPWPRCLIAGHGESFTGEGADPDGALADAARKLAPGVAVLPAVLAGAEATEKLAEARGDAGRASQERDALQARLGDVEAALAQAQQARKQAEAKQAAALRELAQVREEGERGRAALAEALASPGRLWGDLLDAARVRTVVEPEPEPEPEDPSTALREGQFAALLEEIEETIPIVATAAPSWQRAQIMAWTARAKSIAALARVEGSRVPELEPTLRMLQDLSLTWYPGSAYGLRRDDRPESAGRPIQVVTSDWGRVAEEWQRELDGQTSRALDHQADLGWADGDSLGDPPEDPDGYLDRAIADIEAMTGSLDGPPEIGILMLDRATTAAAILRWVRLSCTWPERWGAAMGRLRWLVNGQRRLRGGLMLDYLSEAYVPRESWRAQLSTVLGDELAAEQQQAMEAQQRLLRGTMPFPGCKIDGLAAWVEQAFAVWDTPELAELAGHLAADIARLDGERFNERGTRSRLARLQRALAPEAPAPAQEQEEEEEEEDDDREDPAIARAREIVTGKRIMVVVNRKDPILERQLREAFDVEADVVCGASAREVQRLEKRIVHGSYEAVWFAHSFNCHTNDKVLSRAASRAKLPFVRVGRGRVSEVARKVLASIGEAA